MFHKYKIGYIIILTLLCSSCFFFNKKSKHNNTIMSRAEVNQTLKRHFLHTEGLPVWDSMSNNLMYSMAMLSDSVVGIGYTPVSGDKSLYAYQFDTLPKEWLDKRDELIEFVMKEERKYRNMPKLDSRYVVRYLSDVNLNKRPNLKFKITSPFIIPELRKNPFVRYVHVYYPVHDIFFLEDY